MDVFYDNIDNLMILNLHIWLPMMLVHPIYGNFSMNEKAREIQIAV